MGHSFSSEESPNAHTDVVSRERLLQLFLESCSKQFSPIELLTIKQNMELHDKDQNQVISETEFQQLLKLPENPNLSTILYRMVKKLAAFPFINHSGASVTFHGLLKAIALISNERYGGVLTGNYDHLKLLFICFANQAISDENNEESFSVALKSSAGVVNWSRTPIVETFDGIDINGLTIPALDLLEIVAFLLVIARLEPQESLKLYSKNFLHFDQYKQQALPIIKSMNNGVTESNLNQSVISYQEFQTAVTTVAKNLLIPLSSFLEILLFAESLGKHPTEESAEQKQKHIHTTSRLVNEFSLSQLSTILKKELVFSNIRKLYVGAESGFSIRSFESKAFKWNAPSIVILKGKRINSNTNNQRYLRFEEEFPRFKQDPLPFQNDNDTIIYGMYVSQPWRITNKDSFGDEKTEIFQLSPIQKIFKSSIAAKHHVYFNTVGGGIGFGSEQPIIKNNFKRYRPGNVSLTLDQNLEFAVFRHLGIGGEFKSVDSRDWNLEYEDRFLISDVEVWGCGGEKELEEQNRQWEWEQKEAKRRQQVNLKSMGEDRALLEMAGIIGGHKSGGSV